MSSLHVCFAPVNVYNIPGLESWLEQMAAKGWRFAFTWGPLVWFEKTAPVQLHIHLEPVRRPTNEEDKDLSALYAAQGWDYVGLFRGTFYLYSTTDPKAQAHTDPELQSYSIARLTRRIRLQLWGLTALLFFLCWLIQDRFSGWSWDLRNFPLHTLTTYYKPLWMLPLLPALILLMLSKFLSLGPLYRIGHALDRGEPMARPKKLKGGGWLKASCFTLLLVIPFFAFQVRYTDSIPLEDFSGQGYVRLEELETAPGFRVQREFHENVGYRRQLLVPRQYNSSEWGRYLGENLSGLDQFDVSVESENGVSSSFETLYYYLDIQYLHCLTQGVADAMMTEQSGWYGFAHGTEMSYPGFDRLVLFREENADLMGLTRWQLYGQRGRDLLLVDYRGRGDFEAFLPHFAQMISSL